MPQENSQGSDAPPAYEVARAYYEQEGGCTYKDLIPKFFPEQRQVESKSLENKLSDLVRAWEKKRLVCHRVLRENEIYLPRRPDLEEQLCEHYKLRSAVVVDISMLCPPTGSFAEAEPKWNQYDVKIHEKLGAWAGRVLQSMLRPEDVVGVGGGRAPYYTVQNFQKVNCFQGEIKSLTASIGTNRCNESQKDLPPLDADYVAMQLHEKLSPCRVTTNQRSITEGKKVQTDNVTLALIGIGALGGGHRLKHYKGCTYLKDIESRLGVLNQLSDEIEANMPTNLGVFFHPVGDLADYYFIAEAARQKADRQKMKTLQNCLDSLNKTFANPADQFLPQIGACGVVLVVAGWPHKVYAIQHALEQNAKKHWITHLVTDHRLAKEVLPQQRG